MLVRDLFLASKSPWELDYDREVVREWVGHHKFYYAVSAVSDEWMTTASDIATSSCTARAADSAMANFTKAKAERLFAIAR